MSKISDLLLVKTLIAFSITIAISLGVAGQEICSDGERYSPHPDCKFYWDCNSGGEPILRECPADLFWDVAITACNLPENVPDCVGGTRLVTSHHDHNNSDDDPAKDDDAPDDLMEIGNTRFEPNFDPIWSALPGSMLDGGYMTGFSTMNWQCVVTSITLTPTFRLRVPNFYLEMAYSEMSGYFDFRPFTQGCLPSGNFTWQYGTAYFETLTFDSLFINLGPDFVIGGNPVDWDAFNENINTCFATELAAYKAPIEEKLRTALNLVISQFTIDEVIDIVTGGDCPICSFVRKTGEKMMSF
ncbi:putative chitinase 3 [Folsomia candida]|uniref:Putative chitinase 3 n=1 Tax=Folsomia candida TaxID=158441 RepID=A0A226D299_FOLCA|nr:putative chitinase 3 [Folsomia candida]